MLMQYWAWCQHYARIINHGNSDLLAYAMFAMYQSAATHLRLPRWSRLDQVNSLRLHQRILQFDSFPHRQKLSLSRYFFCFFLCLCLSSSSSSGPHVGQSGPSTQSQFEHSSLKHPLPSSALWQRFRFVSVLWRVLRHRRHTCSRQ